MGARRRAEIGADRGRDPLAPAGAPYLVFWLSGVAAAAPPQSGPAAAMTATSTGNAAWLAASISSAVSTATRVTPAGVGSWVGPDTSTVSAPSAASAAAIAWPCLPEEWFDR